MFIPFLLLFSSPWTTMKFLSAYNLTFYLSQQNTSQTLFQPFSNTIPPRACRNIPSGIFQTPISSLSSMEFSLAFTEIISKPRRYLRKSWNTTKTIKSDKYHIIQFHLILFDPPFSSISYNFSMIRSPLSKPMEKDYRIQIGWTSRIYAKIGIFQVKKEKYYACYIDDEFPNSLHINEC